MRKVFVTLLTICAACFADAEVTYNYTGQGGVFDGTNWVQVLLNDNGTAVTMTVSSSGGDMNSNASRFGVDNDYIDGTAEMLTISFDKAVDFISIDLGAVGADISDGANLTIGSRSAIDLYTGVVGFSGSTDVYTPASPVRLNVGETIILTGSSLTSSSDLEQMTFAAVPEPATFALSGLGVLLACLIRRASWV